jgi:hypothetical protein
MSLNVPFGESRTATRWAGQTDVTASITVLLAVVLLGLGDSHTHTRTHALPRPPLP